MFVSLSVDESIADDPSVRDDPPVPIIGYSIEANLEPKLAWLQERLDMDDKSLTKLVLTMPPILGFSVEENLEPKLAWLQEWLDMDDKSVSKLTQKSPAVLGMSVTDGTLGERCLPLGNFGTQSSPILLLPGLETGRKVSKTQACHSQAHCTPPVS
jgi:hypothetical protein